MTSALGTAVSPPRSDAPPLALRAFVAVVVLLGIVLARVTAPDGGVQSSSPVAEALWAVLYVVAVIGLLRTPARAKQLLRGSPLILALVLLVVLSTLWSDEPGLTLRRSIGLLGTTMCAYFIVSRLTLEQLLATFADVVALVAVLNLAVVVLAPDIGVMQVEYAGAWRGLFDHKNLLGLFLAAGIITVVIRNTVGRRWRSPLAWAVMVLLIVEFVAARSITSAVMLLACLAVIATVYTSRLGRYRWVGGALVASAIAVAAGLWLTSTDPRDLLALIGRNGTFTGRTAIWPMVWQAISARPLLGYGYGVFWEAGEPYARWIAASLGWLPPHAHDGYLDMTLDVGLVGAALLVVLLAWAVRKTYRYARQNGALIGTWPLAIVTGVILSNVTETSIGRYNDVDWLMFVLAVLATISGAKGAPRAKASGQLVVLGPKRPHIIHPAGKRRAPSHRPVSDLRES